MQMQALRFRALALVASVAALVFSACASADPPSRVARLGYLSGAVSFSPAGEYDWVQAAINRPLTSGDRLWTDADARAEIQVGGAMVRMHADTGVSVLNLDDRIVQLELTQGSLNVRVRRLEPDQVFEVDTPNLAFTLRQPGRYRIEVDPDGYATTIMVRKGEGEVYGEGAAYVIDARQAYRFMGTGLREYEYVDVPRPDAFDRWSADRDRRYDNSESARYVSEDVVGYQDLDENGTWRVDATYGSVWIPNRVAADWAPYRDGHWAWVDPWGWTWVDDAPWGFAVSHYGRWAHLDGTWAWVPGPVRARAYYAPALVVFVGGDNFRFAISGGNVRGVAWFPLGPREVYRPSYSVSRGYFENINRSNTVINNTVINNYYDNSSVTNVTYVNRQVPGAVVAVPTTAFVQSQPVSRAAVRVSREMIASGPLAAAPPVVPTERSVRGAAAQSGKPPPRVFERPVIARTAPPAAHLGFAAQQRRLAAQPGKPLDDTARRELKPAAAAPAPLVKLVAPAQIAQPTALPPPVATGARPGAARGKTDEQKIPSTPGTSRARGTPPRIGLPSQATPPVNQLPPWLRRGNAEQGGSGEQRGQSVAPPPVLPQRARPQPAPAQAAPPVPTAQPLEQRGTAEPRGNAERRGQPVAAPPAPSAGATQPQAAPQQATPAEPAAQSPEQRGRFEQRGNAEQRGQPAAAPPAPSPGTVPPQGARQKPIPAEPAAQAPPQRGRFEQRGQPVATPPVPSPGAVPSGPAAQPPERRGRFEERGQPVTAPPAPPQRAVEPSAVPPSARPKSALPPQDASPAPARQLAPEEKRGQKVKPAADKANDKKKDGDEQKPEEENR